MSKILIDEATVKLALEALKQIDNAMPFPVAKLAQAALREALADQPAQQEPFGYFKAEPFGWTDCAETDEGAVALYTTPQPAQRKPLPKGEWPKHPSPYVNDEYRGYLKSDLDDYAMQVLAAHNIKENT